jgi:hypothetical protein
MKDKILAFLKSERVKKYLPQVVIISLCIVATVIFFTGNMFKYTSTYYYQTKTEYVKISESIFFEPFISIVFLSFIFAIIILSINEKKYTKKYLLIGFSSFTFLLLILVLNMFGVKSAYLPTLKICFEYVLLLFIEAAILALFYFFFISKKSKILKPKPKYNLSSEIENLEKLRRKT